MHPDNHLLARYLAGEASPAEQVRLSEWLAASPDNQAVLDALERVWRLEPSAAPPFDARALTARVLEQTPRAQNGAHRRIADEPSVDRTSAVISQRHGALGRAAWMKNGLIAMGAVAGAVALTIAMRFGRDDLGAFRTAHAYSTRVGQLATVTLDDSTHVTLAPQTTLRVLANDRTTRTVELEGEAYFDVSRAKGAPFIVRSGNVRTRVLGTSFVVRTVPDAGRVHVAVVDGKVSVFARTQQHPSAVLVAGQGGDITDSSAVVSPIDVAGATAWKDGRIIFHQASTNDVLDAVSRWYGYQFRVTDSAIVAHNWTIEISTKSAREALATLQIVFEVDLQVNGTIVTLLPRHRRQTPTERKSAPDGMIDELTHFQRETGR